MHRRRARDPDAPSAVERWLLETGARIAQSRTAVEAIDAFRAAVTGRIAERCHVTLAPIADSQDDPAHGQLVIPLATHGRILAIATLERSASGPFTLRERTIAQDLATRTAQSLAEIRMRDAEARAEAATARTERLYRVAAAISGATTIDDVARTALEATMSVLGAYGGCIAAPNATDGRIEVIASLGFPDDLLARSAAFSQHEPSPVREALESRKVSFFASREEVAARFPAAALALYRSPDVAYATIPLVVNDRAIGTISLAFAADRAVLTQDHAFLEAVGRQCGLALSRAQLFAAEQDARATAERAVAAREDFLTIASHEFRTPLTTISLHLDSLSRKNDDAVAARKAAETRLPAMRRQVDRLARLVDMLLDVSRATVERCDLEFELVDLSALVRTVAEGLASDATAARSSIEVEAAAPIVGTWDRTRLEQLITNLLSNAIKFGAGAPVTVTVSSDAEGSAILRVRDRGIGIAREAQQRVFDRFERAVSAKHFAGFGLGLWIVKAIVDALDGSVEITSAEGDGTTFIVRLPIARSRER